MATSKVTAETDSAAAAPSPADQAADHARRVAQLHDRHTTMLWISVLVIFFSFMLRVQDGGHVGPAWSSGGSLPSMCASRTLFGLECPGCGLTRSFLALAAGDVGQSLAYHRLGWLLALAVVLQIPYRTLALRELRHKISERTWPSWFGWALILALVVNWLLKSSGLW